MSKPSDLQEAPRDRLIEELRIHQTELEAQNAELIEAQADLKRSKQRFQSLFQESPIPYLTCDREGLVLDYNRALRELLSTEEPRLSGKPFVLFVRPEYHGLFFRHLARSISSHREVRDTVDLATSNGEVRTVVLVSTSLNDDDEQPCTMTAMLDQTTIREYENRLAANTELYDRLLYHVSDAVYLSTFDSVGTAGPFVEANAAAGEMLGYSREELFELGPGDIVNDETRRRFPELLEKLLEERRILVETEHMTREGRPVPVEVHAAVVTLKGRRHILSVARDITERKRAEQRLSSMRNVHDALRRANRLMLYRTDPNDLADDVCRTLVEARGYSHAWIVLSDERGEVRSFHQFGMPDGASARRVLLGYEKVPACIGMAERNDGITELDATARTCDSCPARPIYAEGRALVRALRHEDRLYGVLTVSMRDGTRDMEAERDLIGQLSDDLSFSLHVLAGRSQENMSGRDGNTIREE